MNPNPSREETLFAAALELPPAARAALLDRECAADPALRARIEALLKAADTRNALDQPPHLGPTGTIIAPITEKPGDIIGRYKLLQQIGEGGCGVVYMAEQSEPVKRRVALKVIKLGMDTKQVVARFEAERQALAMMDHPNIARVLDAGATDTGRPYFVMELVRGTKLTEFCDEQKLPTRERLDLFMQVCSAIQHAHQKGIIHRDLKPSNILVTIIDGRPVPKVIDFGIAKATSNQQLTDKTLFTAFEQFIGTPAYMSPEQAEMSGVDIDTRSDIYSLGVVLYELLTGETPFDAEKLYRSGLDEIRRTIREEEPARPSTRLNTMGVKEAETVAAQRKAGLPALVKLMRGDLDWVVMKCLEKDRSRRYETASGLAADLQRHLNSEPVLACPPSLAYLLQKLMRRHKVAFVAGTAVAVALLLGIIGSTWQAMRAKRAEQSAKQLLYAANMNLAQSAWEQNNVGLVRQLLDETKTYAGRGFEWYYWQRQTHLEIKALRGHGSSVLSVAFSPDGQRIVTGSGDKTAKVWDSVSGRELLTLKGHGSVVWSVAFSPDGQRIVTGSYDQTAKVWDSASGKELLTLKGHVRSVGYVAFSQDGRRIVTGSGGQVKVWDLASGKELLSLKGHGDQIFSVAFSPHDQRIIIAGGSDKTAKVWDSASSKELFTFKGHDNLVLSVAFSPNGQRIVTGSGDQTAKVWDSVSGKELLTLKGHGRPVDSVVFSPDGQRIVTGSRDKTVKVWDAASGKELLTLKGHDGLVNSVAFSPDGQQIVTGSGDKTAKVWEVFSRKELLTFERHGSQIRSVGFSPDGQRIVTGSYDKAAKIWDWASGKELLTLKGHSNEVFSVAFSPDGQRIVTGSLDQTAKVWDWASGKELFTLKGHSRSVLSVVFSPDGQRIVTGSDDQTAKVWDSASGKELLTLKGHSNKVSSVAFSPDSQRIVTGSWDQTAKVWDAASGSELHTLEGHRFFVYSVGFSPDGQQIVTGSGDQTAKVWDSASGKELLTLKGHSDAVRPVVFSPDGQRIVTGSGDQTAKVWDSASGKELFTLKGHGYTVTSVAFSQDGRRIVTGSDDDTAKVWEAATPQQVAAWQAEEKAAEFDQAEAAKKKSAAKTK